MISEMNWYPYNQKMLNNFIEQNKEQGKIAVFDWDNTCIFNDISEMILICQLSEFFFKLDIQTFKKVINVSGLERLDTPSKSHQVPLQSISEELIKIYSELYQSEKRSSQLQQRFKVLMLYFYDYLCTHPNLGAVYAYPWICQLWSGFKKEEVEDFAVYVIKKELETDIYKEEFEEQVGDKKIKFSYQRGIRLHPEIIELVEKLRKNKIETYIVTSSPELVIQAVAKVTGYQVKSENIFGMRVKSSNGLLSDEIQDDENYPMIYGIGKVEVIKKKIKKIPVFIAGDSNNDYPMLSHWKETELKLVINCNNQGPIEQLYREALNNSEAVLLQGRSLETGLFNKSRETK